MPEQREHFGVYLQDSLPGAFHSTPRFLHSQQGEPETFEYRVFFTADNYTISPWHNVPLVAGNGTHTFIVEIPKNTSAKYEVQTVRRVQGCVGQFYMPADQACGTCATLASRGPLCSLPQEAALNPIAQDLTSKGSLRHYHSNIAWNYGLLPQTWEDPAYLNPDVNATVGWHKQAGEPGMRLSASKPKGRFAAASSRRGAPPLAALPRCLLLNLPTPRSAQSSGRQRPHRRGGDWVHPAGVGQHPRRQSPG